MLTPTGREVAETQARKVPSGATIWGGRYDGSRVVGRGFAGRAPASSLPFAFLLLEDGTELRLDPAAPVAWLHPAGRRTRA